MGVVTGYSVQCDFCHQHSPWKMSLAEAVGAARGKVRRVCAVQHGIIQVYACVNCERHNEEVLPYLEIEREEARA